MFNAAILLHGDFVHVLAGQTVATLLRSRGLCPETVVVELNGRRQTPGQTKYMAIKSGDILEVAGCGCPPYEGLNQNSYCSMAEAMR